MAETEQLLNLVFDGRVKDPQGCEFEDLGGVDIVGNYVNFREAKKSWRAVSQRKVDIALMKYWVVHLHRLLQPENPSAKN